MLHAAGARASGRSDSDPRPPTSPDPPPPPPKKNNHAHTRTPRSPGQHADTDLRELNAALLREEEGLVANRGLVSSYQADAALNENQTFFVYVPQARLGAEGLGRLEAEGRGRPRRRRRRRGCKASRQRG